MRVYVDSSALVKRVLDESERPALIAALEGFRTADAVLLSSTLTWIECPITEQIVGIARRLGPSSLRSVDAIHLASATLLSADVVCAYDKRLLIAASELGFRTISP
ncbi:MAG: type II toxin-antitoxin system VapC family toxin [Lacisediminihabitans sp.]